MRVPSFLSIAVAVFVVCIFYVEDAISGGAYGGHAPSCGCPGGENPPQGGYPGKPTCKQDSLFGISNTLTSKLVRRIIDTRSGSDNYASFAISVFNILHVLLLITNAACKETLQQLLKYLRICDLPDINSQFGVYRPELQENVTVDNDQKALIRTFAALYPADYFKLKPDYVSQMKRIYGANVQTVPYATDGQKALNTINNQISQATFGFFPQFFSSEFDPSTVLVLCATLFLRISWQPNYFYQTSKIPFYQFGTGSTTYVQFLNNGQGVGAAAYAEMDGYKFVQVPTYLDQFTLILFYPKDETEDPALYLKTVTSAKIRQIFGALENVAACQVNVTMAPFDVSATYDNLIADFEAGGVTDLFQKANLCKAVEPSPFSDKLKVSQVVHKARVQASKYGLTAVAATAVVVTTTAVRMCQQGLKQFYANRPFCYFVADKTNKVVLFAGIVYKLQNN